MRVVINGRFLTRQMTGVDRVAENLVLHLDRIWPVEHIGKFIVSTPKGDHRKLDLKNGVFEQVGTRNGTIWEQVDLPRHFKGDIIFNPCNTAPAIHDKNIVIIHDTNVLDYPASYSSQFRLWYRFLLPILARRALSVCTVSEHSRARLKHHKIASDQVAVIPNGCDHLTKLLDLSVGRSNSVIFVGSPAAHKNLDLFIKLAREFEAQAIPFKVAGAKAEGVFSDRHTPESLPSNLTFLGRVTDEELIDLYQTSRMLLFPSFVEGFGLTPLEAQSYGCPVISSDRQPMSELLDKSAILACPNSAEAWITEIQKLLSNDEHWQAVSDRGQENAKKYQWSDLAQRYLNVLLSCLAKAQPIESGNKNWIKSTDSSAC